MRTPTFDPELVIADALSERGDTIDRLARKPRDTWDGEGFDITHDFVVLARRSTGEQVAWSGVIRKVVGEKPTVQTMWGHYGDAAVGGFVRKLELL